MPSSHLARPALLSAALPRAMEFLQCPSCVSAVPTCRQVPNPMLPYGFLLTAQPCQASWCVQQAAASSVCPCELQAHVCPRELPAHHVCVAPACQPLPPCPHRQALSVELLPATDKSSRENRFSAVDLERPLLI